MNSSLFQVKSLFYQGAYKGCVDAALSSTSSASSSDPTAISILLYAARSHLAASPPSPSNTLSILASLPAEPHVEAVRALARFIQARLQDNQDALSKETVALTELLDHAVVGEDSGQVIRCAAATALYLDGDSEEALETLGVGSGTSKEIECVALGVHILLSIHRIDLAQKEYQAARVWADDSLMIQLIEAWIGIATGGRSTQQAYYVYDELAQNPSASGTLDSVASLIGKANALACNGDVAGARKQLDEAGQLDPENADIIANQAALAAYGSSAGTSSGSTAELLNKLRRSNAVHPLLREYEALDQSFEEVAARFALGAQAA